MASSHNHRSQKKRRVVSPVDELHDGVYLAILEYVKGIARDIMESKTVLDVRNLMTLAFDIVGMNHDHPHLSEDHVTRLPFEAAEILKPSLKAFFAENVDIPAWEYWEPLWENDDMFRRTGSKLTMEWMHDFNGLGLDRY